MTDLTLSGGPSYALIALALFCILLAIHIRTLTGERDQAKGEKAKSLEVLGFLRKDLKQLRVRLKKLRNEKPVIPDDPTTADPGIAIALQEHERKVTTIWTRAGEDLLIAREHRLFDEGKYAALWSCIRVAEVSPTTGTLTARGEAVFSVAVSWWEQERDVEGMLPTFDDKLDFGMKRFIREINDKLGDETSVD